MRSCPTLRCSCSPAAAPPPRARAPGPAGSRRHGRTRSGLPSVLLPAPLRAHPPALGGKSFNSGAHKLEDQNEESPNLPKVLEVSSEWCGSSLGNTWRSLQQRIAWLVHLYRGWFRSESGLGQAGNGWTEERRWWHERTSGTRKWPAASRRGRQPAARRRGRTSGRGSVRSTTQPARALPPLPTAAGAC